MADLTLLLAFLLIIAVSFSFWLAMRQAPVRVPAAPSVPRRCGSCAHFDLKEGQAILDLYPAFPKQDLPPCLIGAQYDEVTGGLLRNESVPAKCSWTEFGACSKHTELRWLEDACDDFKPTSTP